jgi:hypothetical protein
MINKTALLCFILAIALFAAGKELFDEWNQE